MYQEIVYETMNIGLLHWLHLNLTIVVHIIVIVFLVMTLSQQDHRQVQTMTTTMGQLVTTLMWLPGENCNQDRCNRVHTCRYFKSD